MLHDEVALKALRQLRERVAQEHDPKQLCELVIEINILLGVIEVQVAKIEDRHSAPPTD